MRRSASTLLLAAACAVGAAGCQVETPVSASEVAPDAVAAQSASATPTPLPSANVPAPAAPAPRPQSPVQTPRRATVPVAPNDFTGWQSRALGRPSKGRLVRGTPLPPAGPDHITYDPILHRLPNRDWRTWGTDKLVWTIQAVAATYRAVNPGAPPLLVGDLSRPTGGVFDGRFGGLGHASHQNGLDVDIQYPRKDRRVAGISKPSDVDMRLAQSLVDHFVAAGAQFVFVGPRVRLKGPKGVVQPLRHHDDHLHVRLFP